MEPSVTREQFRQAVEAGITAATAPERHAFRRPDEAEVAALREYADIASVVVVGSYEVWDKDFACNLRCPVAVTLGDDFTDSTWDLAFARAYDDAMTLALGGVHRIVRVVA